MSKKDCSRRDGSKARDEAFRLVRNFITECVAVGRDLVCGALPLRELPGFLAWRLTPSENEAGGMRWTNN